ncbi:hypothetical protein SAMN03159488_02779 [Pseudomonas sp. NFIX10]|nr:hypothetical protein SAMN03159481_01150 [Pseudomonas sp. NFACC56-3]SFB28472.1 hypothetical protein SAMN03159488_02779 [Pseudomonas sp. NFIX10]SFE88604.1 hypothetical protein SAMN03159367_02350 [Pseudomonas sp. NFACC06-1]SFK26945.1 hypothetical protein SAMN03159473_01056 [Pseudomonas sp. NFACC52]
MRVVAFVTFLLQPLPVALEYLRFHTKSLLSQREWRVFVLP